MNFGRKCVCVCLCVCGVWIGGGGVIRLLLLIPRLILLKDGNKKVCALNADC